MPWTYFKCHSEQSTSEGKNLLDSLSCHFNQYKNQLHYLKALLECVHKSTYISKYLPQVSILVYKTTQIYPI